MYLKKEVLSANKYFISRLSPFKMPCFIFSFGLYFFLFNANNIYSDYFYQHF